MTHATFLEEEFADAAITQLVAEGAQLRLFVLNWRDQDQLLVFEGVIGLESQSFINAALSHADQVGDDDFLRRCCDLAGETMGGFHCYRFYSAWIASPLLKIVARGFRLEAIVD